MRLLIRWLLNAAALFGIAYFAPEFGILEGFRVDFQSALIAVLVLAILNLTVKPILKLLTLPISCMTFGLFTLVINTVVMLLAGEIVPGLQLGGVVNAFLVSILFAVISATLNAIFNKDDDD